MAATIDDLFKPRPPSTEAPKPLEQTPKVPDPVPPADNMFSSKVPDITPEKSPEPFSLTAAPPSAMPIPNPLLQSVTLIRKEVIPQSPLPKMPEKFDTTPLTPNKLKYITIYAGKGASKSTTALAFPGKIVALSFDYKTVEAWNTMFDCDPRITVYDAIRYMDYSSKEATLMSSEITFQYINKILEDIRSGPTEDYPDWILFDGFEEYKAISEFVMRYRNQLSFTQGVEWQYWKDRKLYIKQMFIKMANIVKQGVIFCTKYDFEETRVNGVVTDNKKKPVWFDIVEEQTDILIENSSEVDNATGQVKFWSHILSSKKPEFRTGRRVNITCEPGKVDIYEKLTGQKKEM